MKKNLASAWNSTPATSVRILSAISRIAAVLRTGAWQFATAEGLNPTQVDILEMLSSRAEGVRLSWIARQLGVTAASASDSVASLTAKGLVKKSRASNDGRAVALRLSSAGRALANRISQATDFALDAADRLPEPAQHELFAALLALIGNLQKSDHFPEIRVCVTCQHFVANAHPGEVAMHHCRLVNAPLPKGLLRLDCAEHVPADPAAVSANWRQLECA